jgi:sensor histidine kinase regulating citrate/malate metabolism
MQALLNIINNAKDALLSNDAKNRTIEIDIKKRLSYIIINISDNGPGVPKKKEDKIFLQYYSTKEKGHGIGLYMTKLIIEDKLKGRISYIKKEIGSCFRIIVKESDENFSS